MIDQQHFQRRRLQWFAALAARQRRRDEADRIAAGMTRGEWVAAKLAVARDILRSDRDHGVKGASGGLGILR
jgi:hypothetical protein